MASLYESITSPFSSLMESLGITSPGSSWAPTVSYGETAPPPTMGIPATPTPLAGESTGPIPGVPQTSRGGFLGGPLEAIWGTPHDIRLHREDNAFKREERVFKTDEERKASEASNQIIKRIGDLREEDPEAQPHQLMRKAMQDPAFIKNFHRVPAEQMQKLIESMSQATQVTPKFLHTAPGHAQIPVNPNTGLPFEGGAKPLTQPESHIQLQEWQLKLPAADIGKLALIQGAMRKGATDSDKEQAFGRLKGAGLATQENSDKIIAGTVRPISINLGEGKSREMVIDFTNPNDTKILWDSASQLPTLPPPGPAPSLSGTPAPIPAPQVGPAPIAPPPQVPPQAPIAPGVPSAQPPAQQPSVQPGFQPAPGPALQQPGATLPPGATTPQGTPIAPPLGPQGMQFAPPPGTAQNPLPPPTARDPLEPWDVRKKLLQKPASMYDVAGGVQNGVTWFNNFLGNFGNLSRYNADAVAKQEALYMQNHALTELLKDGRELKGDVTARQALQTQLTSLGENPHSALIKSIGAHDVLLKTRARTIDSINAKKSDGTSRFPEGSKGRERLDEKLRELDVYFAVSPDMAQMQEQLRDYDKNGVPSAIQRIIGVKTIKDEAVRQGTELKKGLAPLTEPRPKRDDTLTPGDLATPPKVMPKPEEVNALDRAGLEKKWNELGGNAGVTDAATRKLFIDRAKAIAEELKAEGEKIKRDQKKDLGPSVPLSR